MVMDTFRQKYLNNEKNEGKKNFDVDLNPMREKYLKWLKSEEKRSSLSTKKVPKIASKEISDIQKQHFNEEPQTLSFESLKIEQEINVKKEENEGTYVFNPDVGYQNLQVQTENPDFIKIPDDVKHKYKFFRMGDTVYDRDGYFLYRVPGLT